MGFLDWLTTTIGVLCFGATEVNPLFSGLSGSSMLIFSLVKLSAVAISGFAFYKAGSMGRIVGQTQCFAPVFVDFGYGISLIALTALVTNNIMTIARLI